MNQSTRHTQYFYDHHPISLAIVLARLEDALATRAGIGRGGRVADFCAGLGGPARYYAHAFGADVTGIELTPARVAGAAELTRLVRLQDHVRVLHGDITVVPLADGSMDAVVSQEALLHVSDKGRALGEAFRILRPGGRLAFSDWICHVSLSEADAALMWEGMAAQTLQSLPDYHRLLETIGFHVLAIEDLTLEWGPILQQRLAMYQAMRREAEAAGTPVGHDAFHRSYVRFVELILARQLGGIRATAEKP